MTDPLFAIASNGPAAGSVFECDLLQLDVTLITDDGTYRYARVGFCTSEKAHRIAVFAFTHSVVS